MEPSEKALDTTVRLWPRTLREAASKYATLVTRYDFAKRFAAHKTVCDVACGVGYGSLYLAQVAKSVVGIDISEEAIAWANRYFASDKVRFFVADLQERWPVEDRFEVLTSFETMEHLHSPRGFLQMIDEHVVPGGVLLLSVPNGPLDRESHGDNPHHVQHFSSADLQRLLRDRFQDVEYFSQVYTKDLRHYAAKLLTRGSVRLVGNFHYVPGLLPDVKTWLAVART